MRWLLALVGALLGGAVGLFGPVFVLAQLTDGSGSYESFLPLWLASLPLGLGGGAVLGFVLGSRSR